MVTISPVRTRSQADAVAILAREFIDWLNNRYPEMAKEIAHYLEHQKFEEQISDVRVHYCPPKGECLLAEVNGVPVGILMLKDNGKQTCEMNRMFVRKSARGLGVGRSLMQNLIRLARNMGFETMVLGALPRHDEALPLYKSAGFLMVEATGRAGTPDNAIHMELDLRI